MVTIHGYSFEGGYPLDTTVFKNIPAIYVVYTNDVWLDVGETDKLGERILNHERKDCWITNSNKKVIHIAVLQESNQDKRLAVESELRSFLNPICGEK